MEPEKSNVEGGITMKKCKNEKRKKYKKTIQVCTLSAFCLTAATGGLIMENTYADEILLIPNVTQSESQSDTQSQNANNESYVQIISEDIKRTNSVGKEYFHRVRSYPEVSMPDHPQAADKINAYYQNEILAQDDQDAEEFIQNSVSDAESYDLDFSYEYTQEINCMRADEAVISFSIMNTDYTGGAHGGEGITSENFASQTGTHLSLTDVMTEDPMSAERLAALVADRMQRFVEVFHGELLKNDSGKEIICVDGKAERGTVQDNGRSPDMRRADSLLTKRNIGKPGMRLPMWRKVGMIGRLREGKMKLV